MVIFVDTSAVFAILDADDRNHAEASALWQQLITAGDQLLTTNYIIVEIVALVQRRLGFEALDDFFQNILPYLLVGWVSEEIHQRALQKFLEARRRLLSFVDIVSFEFMRKESIEFAFTFDHHFAEHGFQIVRSTTHEHE